MTIRMARPAGALLGLLLCPTAPALAAFYDHTVTARYAVKDAQGNITPVIEATDNAFGHGPIPPVSAFIGGRDYSATATANDSGAYGLVGEQFAPGLLRTEYVFESNSALTNTNPYDVRVLSSFIISGGRLQLLAAAGSRIDYRLEVEANDAFVFASEGHLVMLDDFQHAQFTAAGDSIGARFIDNPHGLDFVDIPLTSQAVDFGILRTGESVTFEYSMQIHSDLGPTEIGAWRFQDPFNLAAGGGAPMQFTLLPLGPTIDLPAPAGLPLLFAGLIGWALLPRRWP